MAAEGRDFFCMLQVGESEKELGGPGATNPYARLVDEAEGLDKIEELQNHTNEDIYEKVCKHRCRQRAHPLASMLCAFWGGMVLTTSAC
jgi:Atypical Arm repeat